MLSVSKEMLSVKYFQNVTAEMLSVSKEMLSVKYFQNVTREMSSVKYFQKMLPMKC